MVVLVALGAAAVWRFAIGPPRPPRVSELPTIRITMDPGALERMCEISRLPPREVGSPEPERSPHGRAVFGDLPEQGVRISAGRWHGWDLDPSKPSMELHVDGSGSGDDVLLERPADALALAQALPNWIAAKHGLISDGTQIVRVFVDDRYCGVYLRAFTFGDAMALASSRAAGTFFVESQALDAARDPDGVARFQRLWNDGDAVRRPETAVDELIDMPAWARCSAIELCCGVARNARRVTFLSPVRGFLEPVVSGDGTFGGALPPEAAPDFAGDPVLRAALADPRFVHERNRSLHELLATDFSTAEITASIDEALARAMPDLRADRNLGETTPKSFPLSPVDTELAPVSMGELEAKRTQLLDWIERRRAFLEAYLSDARVRVESDPNGGSRVEVSGSASVRVRRKDGSLVHADTWAGTPDVLYPGLSSKLREIDFVVPAPLAYHVDAAPDELHFENALTREVVVAQSGRFEAVPLLSVHPSKFTLPNTKEIVLGPGELVLDHDLVTERGQPLTIRPDTHILLARGVGIYARGPVYALGLPEHPIELAPRDAEPWACVGIVGAETAGSRLEYFTAVRGSRGVHGAVRFAGMLSIYDCPDVAVRECRFVRNLEGSAAVEVAQSRADIERCMFDTTCEEALELDVVRGAVRECRFVRSGGDSIHTRACDITLSGCSFANAGRAGFAVGEASDARAVDCTFDGCEIGVDVMHG